MSVWREELRLRSSHVDMHRRMRTSVLFGLMQEAAIRHTEELGMGRAKTLDRGLLWVVTLQSARIERMPVYDEDVVLRSWPGRTMHVLFPRYCALDTAAGEPLVRASALWTLVDSGTRKLAFPERYGIEIDGVTTGEEIPLPNAPRPIPPSEEVDFTVPFSFVDLNGHMNNTRYFDIAEDRVPAAAAGQPLRALEAEFCREARLGETFRLCLGREENDYYLSGEGNSRVFRMRLRYGE